MPGGPGLLLGVDADGVALTGGATAALLTLLAAWPLPTGAEVGVVPGEWAPNVDAFTHHRLRPRRLAVDGDGVLDLEALERTLRADPPELVHLTHLASHRGLVQPVAEALALCRTAGVPLWVDVAQSLGHLDTEVGADASYAPARKWLNGTRGVGVLAVAVPWALTGCARSAPRSAHRPAAGPVARARGVPRRCTRGLRARGTRAPGDRAGPGARDSPNGGASCVGCSERSPGGRWRTRPE